MILLIMKIFCILTVPISVFYVWYFTTLLQDVIIEENQAMVQGSTSFLTAAHDSTIISKSKFNIKNSEAFKIIRTQKVLFITVQLYISIFLNIKRNSYLVEKKKTPGKQHLVLWEDTVFCFQTQHGLSLALEAAEVYVLMHFTLLRSWYRRSKWQPTPVFLPGESHGRWATVHGISKSRTRLSNFTSLDHDIGVIYPLPTKAVA